MIGYITFGLDLSRSFIVDLIVLTQNIVTLDNELNIFLKLNLSDKYDNNTYDYTFSYM